LRYHSHTWSGTPDVRRIVAESRRELKRGSLELIVLHLLDAGEAYGYEIVTKLTTQSNGALGVNDGTLYPVLYRLERAGFVAVRWETPSAACRASTLPVDRPGTGGARRLKAEWSAFASAMAKLLGQEKDIMTGDLYIQS
jgi:PadR family transcriptional regulator PadR